MMLPVFLITLSTVAFPLVRRAEIVRNIEKSSRLVGGPRKDRLEARRYGGKYADAGLHARDIERKRAGT
jgi:hypothetical protein